MAPLLQDPSKLNIFTVFFQNWFFDLFPVPSIDFSFVLFMEETSFGGLQGHFSLSSFLG